MSVSHTRSAIEQFLGNHDPRVLAIRGDWGVGKTYLWNEIMRDWRNKYHLDKYAYVSLFGVDSLRDLREQIFQKIVGIRTATTPPTVETANENLKSVVLSNNKIEVSWLKKIRRASGLVKNVIPLLPYIGKSGDLFSNLTFMSVRKTLICLDDIERKGKNLRIEDIFGLISELKEEKQCSVVILMNGDALQCDDKKGYEDFRDKIVDIEVTMVPVSQECVELVVPSTNPHKAKIVDCATRLHITNMRVLRRCTEMLGSLSALLVQREIAVVDEVVKSIVLFCWCWFHRREGVPTLDSVIAAGNDSYGLLFKKAEDATKDELALQRILNSYEYFRNSVIDEPLADFVRHGYYDQESLLNALVQRDVDVQASNSKSNFQSLFEDFYYNQFTNNEEELIKASYTLIEKNGKRLNGYELDQLVKFLRRLDHDNDANRIIDIFIEMNKENNDIFNRKLYRSGMALTDKLLIAKFDDVYRPPNDSRPVFDVALDMAKSKSWGPDDVAILARQTADDFYSVFRNTKHADLFRVASWLVSQAENDEAPEEWQLIGDNVRNALEKIGRENPINLVRVRGLGIDLDISSSDDPPVPAR